MLDSKHAQNTKLEGEVSTLRDELATLRRELAGEREARRIEGESAAAEIGRLEEGQRDRHGWETERAALKGKVN